LSSLHLPECAVPTESSDRFTSPFQGRVALPLDRIRKLYISPSSNPLCRRFSITMPSEHNRSPVRTYRKMCRDANISIESAQAWHWEVSEYLSEGRIDASSACERMLSSFERSNSVIHKARGTTPYDNIAAFETQPAHGVRTACPAPQENGRKPDAKRKRLEPKHLSRHDPGGGRVWRLRCRS
jgi:hypothetical protein